MSGIDAIPSLIPVPAPIPSRNGKRTRNNEELLDKYAILFSPPTPRASPTPGLTVHTSIPPIPDSVPSSSSDGSFGSFVSVPASEDPLARFTPIGEDMSSHRQRNASHDFFDKFAQEAKLASEKNKHGILDELLLSDVDPLYWPTPPSKPQQQTADVHDLDLDFFMPKQEPSSMPPPLHHRRHQSSPPSRSPTLSTATLAPPIASASYASSPPSSVTDLEQRPTPPPRSPSYQTLSNISARWLSTKQASPPQPRHETLQSLFNPPSELPISHGTPFASHDAPYIPPTGAPGYNGENRNWDKGYSEELERTRPATPSDMGSTIAKKTGYIELVGRREYTTGVLDTHLANRLRPYLPALARLPRTWSLLYSLDQHGISLNTLYARCELPKPTAQLLIIQDANDSFFGIYMGEGIKPSKGRGYFGSGECFMFKCTPSLKVFKWTGRNDYIALCEPTFLSFGGGDGQYGLYLDAGLIDGSSAACPTFENEPLCGEGPLKAGAVAFECVGLEVWKVGT